MSNQILSIQVLGSGCPSCKKLLESVKAAVSELKLEVNVEYVDDIKKIVSLGVMSLPAMTINGEVVLTGYPLSSQKVKELIISQNTPVTPEKTDCCSCCG